MNYTFRDRDPKKKESDKKDRADAGSEEEKAATTSDVGVNEEEQNQVVNDEDQNMPVNPTEI